MPVTTRLQARLKNMTIVDNHDPIALRAQRPPENSNKKDKKKRKKTPIVPTEANEERKTICKHVDGLSKHASRITKNYSSKKSKAINKQRVSSAYHSANDAKKEVMERNLVEELDRQCNEEFMRQYGAFLLDLNLQPIQA